MRYPDDPDEEHGADPFHVNVCSGCKKDVAARGYKLCDTCLEQRRAAKARNPEWRAKLVISYHTRGTLYPATGRE